jgi:hypothetical protein
MQKIWLLLLPELRRFSPDAQEMALVKARETDLDAFELFGTALAVAAVAALTQYGLGDAGWAERLGAAALNFAVAVPLMLMCAGPFQIRRLRRGLRAQLELRGRDD